jgi:hypothetical protein
MKPIAFPEAIKDLQPSGKEYSDNVIAVKPLPFWTDGEQCVSKWRLSWRERIAMLTRGTVWVQVLSGSSQPPITFWTGRKFFTHEAQ